MDSHRLARRATAGVAALAALLAAAPAQASFPGANGRIAYTWSRGGEGYESGPHPRLVGVVSARPDGSSRRLVARGGRDPVYSPDGRRFAFLRSDRLWVARANGDHARPLTPADWYVTDQTWSPGGTRLAFVRSGRAGSWHALYTVGRNGGRPRRLAKTPTPMNLSSSPWSPDGKAIAYTQVRFNSRPMTRIHRDGRVTTLAPLGGDATWSRHGLIAYTIPSGFTDLSRVCLRRGATGELVRCLGSAGATTGDPVWSPDGTRLMLTRTNLAENPVEVWVVRPDGTVVSRAPIQANPVPIFSPDARRLAFTRYSAHGDPRLQYSDLHTLRPDGTGSRRIVDGGWAEAPDWQPRPGR